MASLLAEEFILTHKTNLAEVGIGEFGSSFFTLNESRLPQISFSPNSIAEIAANEVTFYTIVNPGEVRASEVNIFPNNNTPDSISKISSSQNSTTKINREVGIYSPTIRSRITFAT